MAGSGLVALVAMSVAHALDVPGLTISFSPLAFPSIPLLPVVGILIALVPAFAAPNPIAPPPPALSEPEAGELRAPPASGQRDPAEPDLSGVST